MNIRQPIILGLILILSLLAAFCLFNSFVAQMPPDISIYLLNTRTLLETGDRFIHAHDSKGIMLNFVLAPAVWLLGPTMKAAALTQCAAYLLCAVALFKSVSALSNRTSASVVTPLWVIAAFSSSHWGGRERPEDFGLALATLCFALLLLRPSKLSMMFCGAAATVCFFMKPPLALGPLFLIAGGVEALPGTSQDPGRDSAPWAKRREVRHVLLSALAGVAIATGALLGWIAIFDDIHGWYRQTIQWPIEYKRLMLQQPFDLAGYIRCVLAGNRISPTAFAQSTGTLGVRSLPVLGFLLGLIKVQFYVLVATAVAGLINAYRQGLRASVLLLGAWLAGESLRACIEDPRWLYQFSGLLPPLLISTTLIGLRRGRAPTGTRASNWGWGIALLALSWTLIGTLSEEFRAFDIRALRGGKSPNEFFVEKMRSHYRSGESVLENDVSCEMLLSLNAPRPFPILPLHAGLVNAEERGAFMNTYFMNPPKWIITLLPMHSPVRFGIIGGATGLYHEYVEAKDTRAPADHETFRLGDRFTPVIEVPEWAELLLTGYSYRLVVDTGYAQGWRLEDR